MHGNPSSAAQRPIVFGLTFNSRATSEQLLGIRLVFDGFEPGSSPKNGRPASRLFGRALRSALFDGALPHAQVSKLRPKETADLAEVRRASPHPE